MELYLSVNVAVQSTGWCWSHGFKFIAILWLIQPLASLNTRAQAPQTFIYQLVPIDAESGDIVYTAVVPVTGASTTQLYNRAHHFLAQTMHAGSLLPMAHSAKHQISQCGIITLPHSSSGRSQAHDYRVTIELKIKAGRYRYRLSEFKAHPDSMGHGLAIRDVYRYDKQSYEHSTATAQQLRAWDRSVKAYLSQLHGYMLGRQGVEHYKPL